jgi:hypothetical protein
MDGSLRITYRTGVSTFASRTRPSKDQSLQKNFQVPAQERRNFKICPTAQVDIENEDKTKRK